MTTPQRASASDPQATTLCPIPAPRLLALYDDTPVAIGGSCSSMMGTSTPQLHHGHTGLQNNIIKLKKLFLGMICYANFCSSGELESLHHALADANWKHTMDQEYSVVIKNGAWHLVPAHEATNIIDCKWVYKIKTKANGTIDRYKA
jgi:hypothetical protein